MATAPEAFACKCVPITLEKQYARATRVIVARITAKEPLPPRSRHERIIRYEASVERVLKGAQGPKATFEQAANKGGNCGAEFSVGKTYVIMGNDSSYVTNLCGKHPEATAAVIGTLENLELPAATGKR